MDHQELTGSPIRLIVGVRKSGIDGEVVARIWIHQTGGNRIIKRSESGRMWRPFTGPVPSVLQPPNATADAIAVNRKIERKIGAQMSPAQYT